MSEEKFVDFATVRDLLYEAQDRRGQLTYEQTAALQHAEWAASEARNGNKTNPEVFNDLADAIMALESMVNYPELAAKIAEGLVSVAAKFIRVLILGLFSAARKLAPPPIECPNIPVLGNTEL